MGLFQPLILWVHGFFQGGLSGQAVKMNTQLHLAPRWSDWSYTSTPPIRLYGVSRDTTSVEDSVRGPI